MLINTDHHHHFMLEAIKEAKIAESKNEVPIGAVVVWKNKIIGRGHNLRETSFDSTAHAEMIAIREASDYLQAWRLLDCSLYVTLEPCAMCAGAIVQSRVKQVIYGASDPKAGCAGTLMNLLQEDRFNHQTEVVTGVLQEECSDLLKKFFKRLRK
ncbi:tRNA adenosine(34) deaminase TadA [Chengkuizengella sp. SCS-71B]|uniref:tRNA adenosine(34) deaminase TadA n=1 Tax=Chengkuizengella sp. SCS-71B TaxID=3115290 RepID=UPI0032C216E0